MDIRVIRGAELSQRQLNKLVRNLCIISENNSLGFVKKVCDKRKFFKKQLLKSENVVVCNFNAAGFITAYIVAVPHQSIYKEMKEHDFQLEDDFQNEQYYIESIELITENSGSAKIVIKLMDELIREVDRRGYKSIALHVSMRHELGTIIAACFPVECIRVIPRWHYTDESCHYLVGYLNNVVWLQCEKRLAA